MTDTTISTTDELLQENAFIDVQEWVADLDRKVFDSDFDPSDGVKAKLSIDLSNGALHYVRTYGGLNSFVQDLKVKLVRYGNLSDRQLRAALNVLKQEIADGKVIVASRAGRVAPVPTVATPEPAYRGRRAPFTPPGSEVRDEKYIVQCWQCLLWFRSFEDVMTHKTVVHEYSGRYSTDPSKMVSVLAGAERSCLDLRGLPDGRYAYFDPSQGNDYIFLMVKTIPKRVHRSKKYRWSKFHVGHEWVEAGTIEVREWSQDAKRLAGEQKPGEGYVGEYMEELVAIMGAPELFALMFSTQIGSCSICGKTLTDDDSRERNIGPECYKKWGLNYWSRFKRDTAAPIIPPVTT